MNQDTRTEAHKLNAALPRIQLANDLYNMRLDLARLRVKAEAQDEQSIAWDIIAAHNAIADAILICEKRNKEDGI